MRVVTGYEGEGRRRRPIWSDNQPAEPLTPHRPSGSFVVGASDRERHRAEQRRYKAARKANAS